MTMSKPHEFVRDEHKLKFAPAWLVYVLAVAIIVMIVAFVDALAVYVVQTVVKVEDVV